MNGVGAGLEGEWAWPEWGGVVIGAVNGRGRGGGWDQEGKGQHLCRAIGERKEVWPGCKGRGQRLGAWPEPGGVARVGGVGPGGEALGSRRWRSEK